MGLAWCRSCGAQCAQCRQLTWRLTTWLCANCCGGCACTWQARTRRCTSVGKYCTAAMQASIGGLNRCLAFQPSWQSASVAEAVSLFLWPGLRPAPLYQTLCFLCSLGRVVPAFLVHGHRHDDCSASLCTWLWSASAAHSPAPVFSVLSAKHHPGCHLCLRARMGQVCEAGVDGCCADPWG